MGARLTEFGAENTVCGKGIDIDFCYDIIRRTEKFAYFRFVKNSLVFPESGKGEKGQVIILQK